MRATTYALIVGFGLGFAALSGCDAPEDAPAPTPPHFRPAPAEPRLDEIRQPEVQEPENAELRDPDAPITPPVAPPAPPAQPAPPDAPTGG